MNKRDLFSVGLKFFALVLLLKCVENIFQFILELTVPATATQLSLYSFSSLGTPLHIFAIILFGVAGWLCLTQSDRIAQKYITDQSETKTSRETVLQIVIAYQGITGIVQSLITIGYKFFYLLPVLDITSLPDMFSTLLPETGLYWAELIISVWLLLSYEKITQFLLQKIPAKFWGK